MPHVALLSGLLIHRVPAIESSGFVYIKADREVALAVSWHPFVEIEDAVRFGEIEKDRVVFGEMLSGWIYCSSIDNFRKSVLDVSFLNGFLFVMIVLVGVGTDAGSAGYGEGDGVIAGHQVIGQVLTSCVVAVIGSGR